MFEQLKKFPFGFYVCCLTFTMERLSYYAAKWGIAIFVVLAAAEGGLGLDASQGPIFSSQLVAWTYITPIIGGYIADRWVAPRILVPIGEIMMAAGYVVIARANGAGGVWLSIILIAIGTGFFKGNVSGVNGRQFANDKSTLTTAFSIQYSFVNIGSFCGTTFLPLIATSGSVNGYRTMFMICAVFMALDCIWWLFGMRFFGDAGKVPFKHDNREVAAEGEAVTDDAPLTHVEKNRVVAILILTVLSGIFWLFWYLVYMPVYYEFGPASQGGMGWANWNLGSFEMPTAWFDSANGLFCIILCPVFAALWNKLAQRPQGDISMLTKTGLGIILLGLTMGSMALGAVMSKCGEGNPVGIWIILLAAVCMTVGEVLFSPLGNSFISEYAPKKLLGTLLGVWPLIIFFAGLAYGPLYNWMRTNFIPTFTGATILIFVIGFALLAFTKKFEAMLESEE